MAKYFWIFVICKFASALCSHEKIKVENKTSVELSATELKILPFLVDPVIKITQGTLKGVRTRMSDGYTFYSFLGIPYAGKPNRFQAPEPPILWTGIRDASKEGSACFQYFEIQKTVLGSEDCLYANVHTSDLSGSMPVIVWVFGGAFKFGIGSPYLWGPDKLVRKGAVVVSFNYRLGVFGFINSRTVEAPGNAGLKDIVALLRWLKNEVKNFGGDPNNINLFGASSGGAAVDYVSLSPMSKGLFNKIIINSGTASNSWAFNDDPVKSAFKLGRKLNIKTNDINILMEQLKKVSPSMLVTTADKMDKEGNLHPFGLTFVPSLEAVFEGHENFISQPPLSILSAGNYTKVPQIISFTSNEGLSYVEMLHKKNYKNLDGILETFLPKTLVKKIPNARMKFDIMQKIKQFYFNGVRVVNASQGFTDFLSDTIILYDLHNNVKTKLSSNNSIPIYYTEFAYERSKRKNSIKPQGVAHGDDLAYILTFPQENEINDPVIRKVSDRQVTMIYNFVKYGDPTPSNKKFTKWTPVTSASETEYLKVTDTTQMAKYPNRLRYKFWDEIYQKLIK